MAPRYAVGIDIGGTKIYAGVIDLETGGVISTGRKRTQPERGVDAFTERLFSVVDEALGGTSDAQKSAIIGIGVGIAGPVDRAKGTLISGPNLGQGLDNFPLRDVLAKRFKVPVVMGNDLEIATRGEQRFGAGKGKSDFVCVFIGTGVGASIVQDGVIRGGATGTAGELGHTVVQAGGRICGCGGRGHLEAYASRSAITRVLLAEIARGRESALRGELKPEETIIRSKMIARAAEDGDELVVETLAEAADYLGVGLANVATFYNPPSIIVGGGLIEAAPMFLERATHSAKLVALPTAGKELDILRAGLGDNSGIIGAATMLADRQEQLARAD